MNGGEREKQNMHFTVSSVGTRNLRRGSETNSCFHGFYRMSAKVAIKQNNGSCGQNLPIDFLKNCKITK